MTNKIKSKFLTRLIELSKTQKNKVQIPLKNISNSFNTKYEKYIKEGLLRNSKKLLENSQDFIEQKVKTRHDEVVLSQSRYWARSISWTLIGGTAFGLLWVSIAKTEEIIVTLGKLEPIGGVLEVQMPLEGVAKEILVKEGDRVKKGQVLIKLDTESSEAKRKATLSSLNINQQILSKLGTLVKEGAVSELQYLQQQNRISELKSELVQTEVVMRYQEIIAPANGIVFDLKPKGSGFVARTSEPVLKIVPYDKLKARVEIPSKSIGFVSLGKTADISIDSFPSTDFGVIEGVVQRIGSDALPPDPSQGKGYRFPADIKLNSQFLEMKTGKKMKLPLQVGMSLTANIKLRRVTYLQLLLGTFSDKAKSLKSI